MAYEEEKEAFRNQFLKLAAARGVDDPHYYDALLAIVDRVAERMVQRAASPFTLGIGGAQGSGKSTLARLLKDVLQNVPGLSATVLCLDDFYKTRAERQNMARSVHPLFAVRGVPGTHDMALLNRVVDALKSGVSVHKPIFDKGEDDRSKRSEAVEPVDVLILEGWCWGAIPQPTGALDEAINELEEKRDGDGLWRRRVNDELASASYQKAFDNDLMIFLAVPNMKAVRTWRLRQELGLADGSRVMDEAQIREFIMYYERITRAMLDDMPQRADLTLTLDQSHCISLAQ